MQDCFNMQQWQSSRYQNVMLLQFSMVASAQWKRGGGDDDVGSVLQPDYYFNVKTVLVLLAFIGSRCIRTWDDE